MRHQQSAHAKVHVYQQGWALMRLDQGEKVNRFSFGLPTSTLKRSVLCSQVLICRINLVLQKTRDPYWSQISDFKKEKEGISYIFSCIHHRSCNAGKDSSTHHSEEKKPVIPCLTDENKKQLSCSFTTLLQAIFNTNPPNKIGHTEAIFQLHRGIIIYYLRMARLNQQMHALFPPQLLYNKCLTDRFKLLYSK